MKIESERVAKCAANKRAIGRESITMITKETHSKKIKTTYVILSKCFFYGVFKVQSIRIRWDLFIMHVIFSVSTMLNHRLKWSLFFSFSKCSKIYKNNRLVSYNRLVYSVGVLATIRLYFQVLSGVPIIYTYRCFARQKAS